ncbi:MAG: hypothetical protein PSV13_10960 [Lacunisphaera sp.]|nr:hypothetical protein [Lacunisphaera sp.]
MNIKSITHLVLVSVGIFAAGATLGGTEAGVEFTGWVKDDKGLLLALKGTKSGNTKWVGLGQEFEDYKVGRMDEKSEVLVVTKGGVEFQLPLIRSKVQRKDTEPPPGIKKPVLNNLRRLAAAADQYYLENGVSQTTYEKIVGRTNYVKEINPVDGEEYRGIVFEQGKRIQVQTNQGYIISYLP